MSFIRLYQENLLFYNDTGLYCVQLRNSVKKQTKKQNISLLKSTPNENNFVNCPQYLHTGAFRPLCCRQNIKVTQWSHLKQDGTMLIVIMR